MSSLRIRSLALAAILALSAPTLALAMNSGDTASEWGFAKAVPTAPAAATNGDEAQEAPSFIDLLLGFFFSSAQAAPPAGDNAGATPKPEDIGPMIDPTGNTAN